MATEWREYRIGEIADIVGGSTPSTADPSNFDGDIPWLTPKDLSNPHGRYVFRGARNLSRKGFKNCSAQLLPEGTVLLTSRAPIGYVALAGNPLATNQGFRNLILKPGFNPEFVYYWLKVHIDVLERHASGSTFKELSGSALAEIKIRVPPFPEQRAIAHILGTLDDKIELNRRMNETLEQMARAIFKSWFVDFDPVIDNALGAGNPIPSPLADKAARRRELLARAKSEGRDTCFPKHIAALFPDRFVDSELGPIPAGWRIVRVGDIADCIKGTSYASTDLRESGTALVTLKSFSRGGGYREDGLKPYAGEFKPEQVVHPGELVVACTDITQAAEVIGRPALVQQDDRFETLVASLDVMIIRLRKDSLPVPFLYCLFMTEGFTDHTYAHSTGTTVLHLAGEAIPSYQLTMPSEACVNQFAEIGKSLLRCAEANSRESRTLAALRDELLPMLVNGEIRVDDANKFLKECGL